MAPVLTDFFLCSFSNFHTVPLHKLLMAIVAIVVTKIHNVTPVADLENFGGGDDKIYEHKLCIISKFCMFMINVLDLAQTCWGYF